MALRNHICIAALALAACQPIANTSDRAMDAGKRVATDTQRKWDGLFTYTPPKSGQLPQTRYCYQMQSDVVCYDSPQTTTTAKLIGYQDGPNMSAYQPGGGSLGVSGGVATAGYNTPYLEAPESAPVSLKAPSSVDGDTSASSVTQRSAEESTPFYQGESPYQKGSVVARDIGRAR